MGVSIWIRLKQEAPFIDPLQTDGKLLSKAMDTLDKAAKVLKVRPLSDFYSVSKKQAMGEADGLDLSEEEWEALADDHVWWAPAEGLASVEALLRWTEQNAGKIQRPEGVIADLKGFRSALEAATRLESEFNVAVSA